MTTFDAAIFIVAAFGIGGIVGFIYGAVWAARHRGQDLVDGSAFKPQPPVKPGLVRCKATDD